MYVFMKTIFFLYVNFGTFSFILLIKINWTRIVQISSLGSVKFNKYINRTQNVIEWSFIVESALFEERERERNTPV